MRAFQKQMLAHDHGKTMQQAAATKYMAENREQLCGVFHRPLLCGRMFQSVNVDGDTASFTTVHHLRPRDSAGTLVAPFLGTCLGHAAELQEVAYVPEEFDLPHPFEAPCSTFGVKLTQVEYEAVRRQFDRTYIGEASMHGKMNPGTCMSL